MFFLTHSLQPQVSGLVPATLPGQALALAMLWSGTVEAQGGGAAVQQAAEHHERGLALFRQGNHREAAEEFERAEALAHSRTNVMNLARCYQELGDPERAIQYLDRYLQEPNLPQDARACAERMRQQLQSGGRGGGGGNLAGPWALLGSGLGVLLARAILDIVAYVRSDPGSYDQLESQQEYDDWHDGTTSLAIAGDVLVGVGAAAAVTGLVWLLVARSRRSSSQAAAWWVSSNPVGSGGVMLQLGAWGSP
jgi:tetratricopeptide (TPR) repeat protein